MESRLVLAIEVSKSAQPPLPVGADASEGPDGSDEDAAEAVAARAATAASASDADAYEGGGSAFDEDGPVWPDESQESAMRAEVVSRGETLSSRSAREAEEAAAEEAAEKRGLPKLDDLIERIPEEIRETLEDLFRVKYTKVARSPRKALKDGGGAAGAN